MTNERELVEMALMGYAMKREAIEREIERVRLMLAIDATKGHSDYPAALRAFRQSLEPARDGVRYRRVAKREKARKGGRG